MRKPFKHKLIFPNKSTYLSYSHKKHVHIQIKIQPLHLANEKHLQQYDNMMSNYQLKFKEIVQNNQTTTGSNKTLGGGGGVAVVVVSFLCKKIFIHFNFNCFQVGEFWNPPGDNCTTYTCEKHDDQFIQVLLQKSCPVFNPDDCDPVSTLLPVLMLEQVAVANTSDRRIVVSKANT